ncbi:interferon-induced protein 44-like [Nematolebias whitei]|uniref:interferon-induced protein 44-like n=1 Tax=Nematolebias whitei TaxID=451745 RepID=UPI00189955A6|nr:interferon-induced protein 44-like [Nematolebias whitei]
MGRPIEPSTRMSWAKCLAQRSRLDWPVGARRASTWSCPSSGEVDSSLPGLYSHCSLPSLYPSCSLPSLYAHCSFPSLYPSCSLPSLYAHCSLPSLYTSCSLPGLYACCSIPGLYACCSLSGLYTYCKSLVSLPVTDPLVSLPAADPLVSSLAANLVVPSLAPEQLVPSHATELPVSLPAAELLVPSPTAELLVPLPAERLLVPSPAAELLVPSPAAELLVTHAVLSQPWRVISWGDNKEDLEYIENFRPQRKEVRHIRILLHGPVGSGKSSFINSVSNVLRRRMTTPALVSATTSDQSFTLKFETHKIQKDVGKNYPFVFNDVMGLEEGERGAHQMDISLALKGHVKEGHKFNPISPLSTDDPGYVSSPSPDDIVHVLVCIYSANVAQIRTSTLQKMKEIREEASKLGIPQMAILTKADQACEETEKNLKNVYKSKYVKKKMADFSSNLGIPMNCIFPVKNYSHEIKMDSDVDTLILSALRQMINFGEDYANKLESNKAGR